MLRKVSILAGSVLVMVFCLPGHSQDSPSLGDVARQAQKDKSHAPAAKVITNDDLPAATGLSSFGLGEIGNSKSNGKPGTDATPSEDLDRVELFLTKLDTLDRSSLAKLFLRGVDSDFPGRTKWEKKLFAAKQVYVSQGRDLIQKLKQMVASAQSMQGNPSPDDPRLKDMKAQVKEIVQDSVRIGATFQAVVLEGRDLATQASSR
jgi:hypothetical protein